MIDIQQELGVIATERKGSDVKQAIYDALDKLSKGGGPGPSPTPIDPNEFLPGSAHVRYYYDIVTGRIGVATTNQGEVIPIPSEPKIQAWPQGSTSNSSSTSYQKVYAYPSRACTLFAVVMHRYIAGRPRSSCGIAFYNEEGSAVDSSWTLLYESLACGGSINDNNEQYLSVYTKTVSESGSVLAHVKYGQTSSQYYNYLGLTVFAIYGLKDNSFVRVDNVLGDEYPSAQNVIQDLFTRATGKCRIYMASTWSGPSSGSCLSFATKISEGVPSSDYMSDFGTMSSNDNRLLIGVDRSCGTGKPWILDIPNSSTSSVIEDDVNAMSFDFEFDDEILLPSGYSVLTVVDGQDEYYLALSDGSLIIVKDEEE